MSLSSVVQGIVGNTSTNACENAHLQYPPEIVNHAGTFGILFSTNYNLECTNSNLEKIVQTEYTGRVIN